MDHHGAPLDQAMALGKAFQYPLMEHTLLLDKTADISTTHLILAAHGLVQIAHQLVGLTFQLLTTEVE